MSEPALADTEYDDGPGVDMRQITITTWPHREGVYSWQMFEVNYEGEGRLVLRGQSQAEQFDRLIVRLKEFLDS